MKQIILMRHAMAEQAVNDFDRPLTAYGQKQAQRAQAIFSEFEIDKIIISPAKRTKQTLELMTPTNLLKEINIVEYESLYQAQLDEFWTIITEEDDCVSRLMIIGHMPVLLEASLVLALSNTSITNLIAQGFMPATTVVFALDSLDSWENLMLRQAIIKSILNF